MAAKRLNDSAAKLFGSPARARLLRLFLFNPEQSFTLQEAARRARIPEREARFEMKDLAAAEIVRRARGGKNPHWGLSGGFANLAALRQLLMYSPLKGNDLFNRLKGSGALKLIVLSGIFAGDFDGRTDVLLVGERLSENKLKAAVKKLEEDIGTALHFAALSTQDFIYRMDISDRFLRDVFDYSHQIILDKLDIGLK